jgi:putative SOS response-associated peptidase YedK
MPMIMDADGMQRWLAGEPPVLAPGIDALVQFFPVSLKVNKPSYNEPDCIEPLLA